MKQAETRPAGLIQAEMTQAPYLPMGEPGNQGYEAHHNFSETFEVTQFHCHDYFELYIHVRGGEFMGVGNQLFPLRRALIEISAWTNGGVQTSTRSISLSRIS